MTGSMNRKPALALAVGCVALTGALAASAGAQNVAPPASPVAADADAAATVMSGPSGEQLYMRICAACHMPDGKGAQGAGFYPALAGNRRLGSGTYPTYVIMNGLNGMPPLGELMTDEQVAEVVNYVRTHFGNDYRDAVLPDKVSALRPAQ
jgi:mono/diheme cytochrome c family protein